MDNNLLDRCFSNLATEYIIYNIQSVTLNGFRNSVFDSKTIIENLGTVETSKNPAFKVFCAQRCSPQRLFYFTIIEEYKPTDDDNFIFYQLLFQPTQMERYFYKFAFEAHLNDTKKRHIYIFEDLRTINDKEYSLYPDLERLLSNFEFREVLNRLSLSPDPKSKYEKNQILEECFKRAKSVYLAHKVDLGDEGDFNW
jgi:hypothetical protein